MLWILFGCSGNDKNVLENVNTTEASAEVFDTSVPADTGEEEALLSGECDDAYLLELNFSDLSANIWRYDITTHVATELGVPDCSFNIPGDYMIAMTADSKGMLWMLSRQGDIYQVVPANLFCTYTGINFYPDSQFVPQGLAFMRENETSPDVLYVSGMSEQDLQAYLGIQDGNGVNIIGAIDGIGGTGNNIIDLAGSSDGQLFGLRPSGSQSALTEISPWDATPINDWMLDIPAPNGWSFVSLFGEFWTFTSEAGSNTEVHQYNPDQDTVYHHNTLPFQTVGAAMPTCAPESSGS